MGTASLALLKGTAKASETEEIKETDVAEAQAEPQEAEVTEAPEEATAEEEVTVDVDKMTSKELDALVKEHKVETPEGWSKMKVDEKRKWLKEQFDDENSGKEEAETPAEPEAEEAPKEEAPEEKPKAAAKAADKKPAGKAVAKKSTALEGEIVEPGSLSDIVNEIENLKEVDAKNMVAQLRETAEATYFRLGGVLSVIQANSWYEPYANFREFVETAHGINYRRAMYWIGIYNELAESGVAWAKVSGLGWTKLKELAPVLTPENVDSWLKAIEGKTTLEIIEMVKNHQNKDKPKAVEDQTSKTVTTKTFKVHADQRETIEAAIEKAKKVSGTAVDTAALEFICIDYLGGSGGKKAAVDETLKKMGLEDALAEFEKAFPEVNMTVETA